MSPLELMHAWDCAKAIFALHRTLITKVALYASVSAVIFGAGYTTRTLQDLHTAQKAHTAEVRTVVQQVVKNQEVERKVYVQDLATVRALEAEKTRLSAELADAQRKVNTYVPEMPSGGYLSIGAVRLLDDAARGTVTTNFAASVAAGEDTAASDVTWRELVSGDLDVRFRYNVARQQCNALIDWVETNVVKKTPPVTIKNYE